jgi:hypothetical protein
MGRPVFDENRVNGDRPIKLLLLFLFLILIPVFLIAADFELILSSPPSDEVRPGEIVSLAVLVINNSQDRLNLSEELLLPSEWRNVFGTSSFEIEPDSFDIRLLSFLVPARTLAGDYQLSYRVKSDDGREFGLNFTVKVASNVAIRVELIDGPLYVQAGEGYSLIFSITNNGNVPVALYLRVNDNLSYVLKSSVSRLELEPARSLRVTVEVKTSRTLLEQKNHIVILIAGVESGDGGNASGRSSVLLLPPIDSLASRFRLLPARVSLTAGYSQSFFLAAGLRIEGFLNDEKTRSMLLNTSIPLTGANRNNRFETDLRYRGEILEAGYGSLPVAGQASTPVGTSTRGFDLQLKLDSLKLGAIVSSDLFRYGLFIDWRPTQELLAGFAFDRNLDSSSPSYMSVVLESGAKPVGARSVLRVPFVKGKYDGVLLDYFFVSHLEGWQLRSSIGYSKRLTDPSNNELLKLDFGATWNGQDSLRISLEGTVQRNNPFYFTLPGVLSGYSLRARVDLPAISGLKVSLGAHYASSGTRNLVSVNRNYGGNLSLAYSISSLNVYSSLSGQAGQIGSALKSTLQLDVYGSYSFSDLAYLSARITLKNYVGERFETTAALSGSYIFEGGTRVNLSLGYAMKDLTPSNFSVGVALSRSFVDGGNFTASVALSIAGRDSWKPAFEFKAGYSFPFSLPVWPRSDLASLSGKVAVLEDGKERPIAGVVVRLNNLVAITDMEGEFTFKGIRPGTYYVEIDGQSIERGLVSVERLPLKVGLNADEDSWISLRFLKSSTLRVKVINEEKEPVNLGGIYFTLNNGEESFRLSTRENGEISVPNLRPGKWILSVDGDTLPRGFVVDNQTAGFELKSGSETAIEFKIRKKSEQIIIIDSGVL